MPHYEASDGQLFYFDELPKEGVRKDMKLVSDEYVASLQSPKEEGPVDIIKETLHGILRTSLEEKGYTEEEINELLANYPPA